jgi:hypothetical protein
VVDGESLDNTWTTMAATPATISLGGALVYPGSGDFLYGYRGNNSTTFYRYSISGNTWTTMANTPATIYYVPGTIYYGAALVYPGSGDFLYGYRGNNDTTFYRYSISGNTWTLMANTPAAIFYGGALVSPGSGDFLYGYRGSNSTTFLRYSISGNTWTTMANTPGGIHQGAALVYPGSGDFLYGYRGNNSTTFYRYHLSKYLPTGTFTSDVINLNTKVNLTTLDYTTTLNGQTITLDARAGNTATPDGSWTDWQTDIASGGSIYGLTGNQYVQYRANLSTTIQDVTPSLDSVTINYRHQYGTAGTITSSKYDAASDANAIGGISWDESTASLPAGTTVTVSLKTASTSALLDSAPWTDFSNGDLAGCIKSGTIVTCSGSAIPTEMKDGVNDGFFQYKVALTSDASNTPVVSGVTVTYVVNAAPVFDLAYNLTGVTALQDATLGSATHGQVTFSYRVDDVDSSSFTPTFEYYDGAAWSAISAADITGTGAGPLVTPTGDGLGGFASTTFFVAWSATSTIPNLETTAAKIRVTLDDGNAINNIAAAESAEFIIDTTPPAIPLGNFILDSSTGGVGAGTITFTITDATSTQYRLCNDNTFPTTDAEGNSCAWSELGTNASTTILDWALIGAPSTETVYFQARDVYGLVTALTKVAPATLENYIFSDVTNVNTPSYRLQF